MNKILLLIVVFVFLTSCNDKRDVIFLSNGIYISDVTIITTEDGSYNPYTGHIVSDGDSIIYVGKNKPELKGKYQIVDGKGKYVIPGLIDSHVHITEVQGMLPYQSEQYPELAEAFNKQMPRSYLYHGFTTLINLGGISEEQVNFFNDQPLKPDLYHTGRSGASVANGYPMNFVPEEFRFDAAPNFIYLESEAEKIPEKFNPSDHTPEAVVARIKKSNAIAVKSYYESGFRGMPKLPVPTKHLMVDLMEHTHKHEMILTVHGNSLEAHAFLSDVGVDVIAHGLWNWEKYKEVPTDSLPAEIQDVLDMQIRKQIGYTPTLTVIAGEEALSDSAFLNDPQLKKVVSSEMLDWYKTDEGQWFAKELFTDYTPEQVQKIYGGIQAHAMVVLKYLADNGGLILFGTDTPSAPTYGNQPGHNGYWELKLMHEAGVSLNQILSSATINNAQAFKLQDVGSLTVGKKANMLLLTKNPLEEIEAYNEIEKVISGGKVIEREELAVQ